MKHWFKSFCIAIASAFVVANAYAECAQNQIDVNSDGTICKESKFAVTTTVLGGGVSDSVSFNISAAGTFYVDCGEDGTLSGTNGTVFGKTITRSNVTVADTYTCTYTTGNAKTIRFAGQATGYNVFNNNAGNTATPLSTIDFSKTTPTLIAHLSGSLGEIFPTLGQDNGQQPRFFETFKGCTELTAIPKNFFSGVTGGTDSMFRSTFDRCAKLTEIPEGLFSNITNSAPNLFRSTFYNCTGIKNIPDDLFSGITSPADSMFKYTFYGASGLTGYISPQLFAGLNNETATNMMQNTFTGTGLDTECPDGTLVDESTSSYHNDWSPKVACRPITGCSGTNYFEDGKCLPCPEGFRYNTQDSKTDINQCQKHCPAGTYYKHKYTRLQYLEASGTQYIDTEYEIKSGITKISAEIVFDTPVSPSGFSNKYIGNFIGNISETGGHSLSYKQGMFGLWVVNGKSGTKITITDGFNINTKYKANYTINGKKRYLTLTNLDTNASSTKDGGFSGSIVSENSLKLFTNGCVGGCGDAFFPGRIYSMRFFAQDNLVRDLIPAKRNSDGALGMYDRMTGNFYENSGTGVFVGPETQETFGDTTCDDVGDGYFATDSTINYGSEFVDTRGVCPYGLTTGIENASSINECGSCVGATYYSPDTDSCVNCPSGYTDDISNGKTSESQCARTCSTNNVNIPHATELSGYDYYDGTNNCVATACENGYTEKSGACDPNPITIKWGAATQEAIDINNAGSTVYGGDIRTPASYIPETGKTFKGWMFGRPGEQS